MAKTALKCLINLFKFILLWIFFLIILSKRVTDTCRVGPYGANSENDKQKVVVSGSDCPHFPGLPKHSLVKSQITHTHAYRT